MLKKWPEKKREKENYKMRILFNILINTKEMIMLMIKIKNVGISIVNESYTIIII